MKKILVASVLLLAAMTAGAQRFADFMSEIGSVLVAPGQYAPLPRAGEAFWRDSVPQTVRQSYIKYGERYAGQPWTALPATVFAEFKTNGNRVNYEQLCFDKRRQLAALAMAEVAEGKGRFIGDVANGLQSLCEETWWGIPAHYGKKVPVSGDQTVDLFNAETAGLVAWTAYILGPQLDKFTPLLSQRVKGEIQRRILTPTLKTNYWWKTAGMNWNPWICSNWLACVLLCESDRQRQVEAVGQILKALDAFTDSYKADGGCDEGPGYWDRAAASLYECMAMLDAATGGRINLRGNAKIKAMAQYCYKTYIGNGYVLSFADSHDNRYMQQLNIVYPFARYMDDWTMRQFAAYIGADKDFLHQAATLYDKSGNFPTLGRELFFMRTIGDFLREQPREPLLNNVWLPDLQIWTARTPITHHPSPITLFAAMKGGTNGESHNHNDVGEVVVYADGEPLLIDPGVGEYTSKTFSGDRYSIWTMQSGYHNLPQINGCDQKDGKQYGARVIDVNSNWLTLDIAGAYPEEAAVSSWQRTVRLQKKVVTVTEQYALKAYKVPTRLMFMTTEEPTVTKAGTISLGGHEITYNQQQLAATVEDVSHQLDPLLQGMWGQKMYRIVLTVISHNTKGKIQYRIR